MIDPAPSKITPQHLERLALVYIRQSHPQQHVRHPESVPTQLRLRERLLQWGWPEDRIRVLDGDLGRSATTTIGRHDFEWLLSEVTLGHVGLVAGFQINRLTREDETTCRLIKVCALFDTLLADQDGVYHPEDFNDRLVLNIKGLIGGVELHQIQQRMQQGRLERARRGEWLGAAPIGYVLGEHHKLVFDPDEQVQHIVRMVFEQFDRLGSLSALLRYLHDNEVCLPFRQPGGASPGKLQWRRACRETVRNLLRHPAHAGAYTWGRRPIDPQRAIAGHRGTGRIALAAEDCRVFLPDNHPAYISWDGFQRNLKRFSSHRRHGPEPSPQREIVSLLAGRVFCGRCGQRMQTHYSPRLRYECARRALDHGAPVCGSLPGEQIERLVAEQILVTLEPASLELSLAAVERLEAERAELDRHWQLRLERARQEADRAFRQYNTVEPENRLVARTLERNWEQALQTARDLQEDYNRFRAARPMVLSASERRAIRELSNNLPKLWHAPSTTVADKRRVVQMLLEKVVVTDAHSERVGLEINWMGGTVTPHQLRRPVRRWTDLSNYQAILEHIGQMDSRQAASAEIARSLNDCGYRTCRGRPFTSDNVRQLRSRTGSLQIKG